MNIFASICVIRPSVCQCDNKHYWIKKFTGKILLLILTELNSVSPETKYVLQRFYNILPGSIIYVQRVYNILCCHLLSWLIFISSSVAPCHGTFENQPIPYQDSSFVSYNSLFRLTNQELVLHAKRPPSTHFLFLQQQILSSQIFIYFIGEYGF